MGKKPLAVLALVVVCAGVAGWLVLKKRPPETPNQPPVAALRLESLDETNRVATLSDHSTDADGTLQSWRIAWGDGKEDELAAVPQKVAHTYGSEGQYTISLWCVDNQGATSSPPAMTNITFDFSKRQKALEQAQADAKREADRLAEAERIKQEQQKQQEMAAEEARKAREQQMLEEKRKADAELAQQRANAASQTPPTPAPAPRPLAAALSDDPSSGKVIYTPAGNTLGEYQISKEKIDGKGNDGSLLVILATRCVNFPDTPIPTADWQIDGNNVQLKASRIRASFSQGQHEVTAILTSKEGSQPTEVKAGITVGATGDCVVTPRK